MKTVNLRRFTEPDALREISPRMLIALLDEHREFLASKGVELPPVGSEAELDHEALAKIFTALEDIPPNLVERFHMVRQMSGPRQMDRILDTVRERQLTFPLPLQDCSPEDVAAQLLLTNRALFQELHAEMSVMRYRSFVYFVPRRKRAELKPPESMAALEKTLNSWYEEHQRARSARVFWRRHGNEFAFHVRHAEPIKREGCVGLKDCESGSAIYRPERHGLVIYDARTGELRVHADSDRETELFRLAFGMHLFNDGSFFPASSQKYTLNNLKTGRSSLAWRGIPGIFCIWLKEVEYVGGGEMGAREKVVAPDVFSIFEARRFQIPAEAEIRLARFAALFEGQKKARHFTIRPSNYATFAQDDDATVLEPWLTRQGFVIVPREEGTGDGGWALEYS